MSKSKLHPLGDRVLVSPVEEAQKTKGGIIIPDTVSKERPERGKVVAVGEGKRKDDGTLIPMSVKKGQTILFSKYGPDEFEIDGEKFFILSESNILAVIE